MLIGYDPKTGEIKFTFTDDKYLKCQFPKNTAKISNFLKYEHGLKEMFTDMNPEIIKFCKIIDGKLIKKTKKEIIEIYKIPEKLSILNSTQSLNEIKIDCKKIQPISGMRTLNKCILLFYFLFNCSMAFAGDWNPNRTLSGNSKLSNQSLDANSQENKKDAIDISVNVDSRYELNKTIAIDIISKEGNTDILILKHFKF